MGASELLTGIGTGVLAELVLYVVLTRLFKLQAKAAAMAIALVAILVYVPYAIITWPGADVFAINLAIFLTLAYGLGLIGSQAGKGWHWAPALIVTFFVGVVVINIIFVAVADRGITGLFAKLLPKPQSAQVADSKFPGVVSHDYQEKEALYNQYLKQVEEQHARGWKLRYGWVGKPVANQPAKFRVKIQDKSGKPVLGANVKGQFLRTSNSRDDVSFEMQELGQGDYGVAVTLVEHGLWNLVLHAKKGDDLHEVRASTSIASAK